MRRPRDHIGNIEKFSEEGVLYSDRYGPYIGLTKIHSSHLIDFPFDPSTVTAPTQPH